MQRNSFLEQFQKGAVAERAAFVHALADAMERDALTSESPHEVEALLDFAVNDNSPIVRKALAESFASSRKISHALSVCISQMQGNISGKFIELSPMLNDSDLIDSAAIGDRFVQIAVASRSPVSSAVAAAISEVAEPEAVIALLNNPTAELMPFSLARINERLGNYLEIRESLLARKDLPLAVRQAILVSVSQSLAEYVSDKGWLSAEKAGAISDDARMTGTLRLAENGAEKTNKELAELVGFLRASDQLTPALLLRALLKADLRFFNSALAELTYIPLSKIAAATSAPTHYGFSALYLQASLPNSYLPVYWAVLNGINKRPENLPIPSVQLSQKLVESALAACAELQPQDAAEAVSLIRQFESEMIQQRSFETKQKLTTHYGNAQVTQSVYQDSLVVKPQIRPVATPKASAAVERHQPEEIQPAVVQVAQNPSHHPPYQTQVNHVHDAIVEQEEQKDGPLQRFIKRKGISVPKSASVDKNYNPNYGAANDPQVIMEEAIAGAKSLLQVLAPTESVVRTASVDPPILKAEIEERLEKRAAFKTFAH